MASEIAAQPAPDQPASRRHRISRPTRLRSAAGAALVPIAVLGAISAAETAGRVEGAEREILWNINVQWLMYLVFAVSMAVIFAVPLRRMRLYRLGKDQSRLDNPLVRFKNLMILGLGQHRVPNDRFAGVMHLCIFSSIVVLTMVTITLLVDDYLPHSLHFLHGWPYLVFSVFGDVFGLIGLLGVGMAITRRQIFKLKKLRWDARPEDALIIGFLGLTLLTGFFVEGLRIAVNEIEENPYWSYWSPGGWVIAKAVGGADHAVLTDIHRGLWWFHIVLAFGFLALIAFTKLRHIIYAPANAFLKDPRPQGYLRPVADIENAETFGAGRLQDFSWKQLFETDVCVRCGRCTANCPAWIAGQPLSPMAIIQDMKSYMNHAGPIVMQKGLAAEDELEKPLVGGFIQDESLWACRTCGACVTECPVLIEHIPSIVDMRRHLVMDLGRVTPQAQQALQNIEQRGHPWRGTPHSRETWLEQLAENGVEVPRFTGNEEYLYWVGCSGALVDRNIPISQAVAKLLMEAGVSFGVLGQEETCNGDPARRLGNEYLYQMMTEQVVTNFKENNVQKVITSCPHCFNTFKNEYPDFGGVFEVVHHADFLQQLLEEERLQPKDAAAIGEKITVHDSCYLGRHNDIYESPREVMTFIPEVDLVEMPRNKKTGLCCGAGGGNMWQEEVGARRVNHVRAEEAVATGAGIVATMCPFCIQMFEDGIPAVHPEEEGRMKAMDIAEVLALSVRPLEGAGRAEEAAPA